MKTRIKTVDKDTGTPVAFVILTYLDQTSATNGSGETTLDLPSTSLTLSFRYGLLNGAVTVIPREGETIVVRI